MAGKLLFAVLAFTYLGVLQIKKLVARILVLLAVPIIWLMRLLAPKRK